MGWVFIVLILAFNSISIAESNPTQPAYKVVEQWRIPNGGFGRTIVIKSSPTEGELRALGDHLKRDTQSERNSVVVVYDTERAARNRLAAFNDKLTKAELQYHDRHRVALYLRNANTGYHELAMTVKGLDGPNVKVKY